MKVWATERSFRSDIADAPEKWFDLFAVNQPDDIRKFGDATNSTLVYRVSAVLEAIEERRYFRKRPVSKIVAEAVARGVATIERERREAAEKEVANG